MQSPLFLLTNRKGLKLTVWILVIGAAAIVAWTKWNAPMSVRALQPVRGPLAAEVFGTGTLEAKVVVALSAKITGRVIEVLADQGDTVTNRQVVARLEATDYENSVRVAEAGLNQAQAELVKAQADIARERDLIQSSSISQGEFDTYEAAYRVAQARLKNAEAQLGFARARLADTVIYSPVGGLVLVRNLEVGDTVVPGTPIFRLADTQLLWIAAMVDEREVGQLRVGQPARITFRAHPSESFPGRIGRLAREADRVTEEREADVVADRLPPDWFIGAKADVYIEAARKADVLQIPKSAIVRHGDQPGLFVIDNSHAHWQPVRLGLAGRENLELASGVDIRDLVITDPFADKKPIIDGQRVDPSGAQRRP